MKKFFFIILAACVFMSCSYKTQTIKSNSYPAEMNVMTFNIRYDNPADNQNNWKFRKERVANSILFYEADVAGMQEVLHNQLVDLQKSLPSYKYVGAGRTDGKEKGEYSPIFYNADKLMVVSSGNFWLSETPESVGIKGWDAAIERIATWAILSGHQGRKPFFVLNTHFDHIGTQARRESGNLIMKKVSELAGEMPVMVMGDFNASPESFVVTNITDSSNPLHLTDSRTVAPLIYGPEWSFHGFGKSPLEERERIDYIFIKNNIKVLKYGILAEQDGVAFLSDHCPVLIKVQF